MAFAMVSKALRGDRCGSRTLLGLLSDDELLLLCFVGRAIACSGLSAESARIAGFHRGTAGGRGLRSRRQSFIPSVSSVRNLPIDLACGTLIVSVSRLHFQQVTQFANCWTLRPLKR